MKCKMKVILLLVVATLAYGSSSSGGFVRTWGGTGNTAPACMALDGSSNVYVVGGFGGTTDFDPGNTTNSRTAGGFRDAFMTKFSSDGTWLWTKTWGSSNDDRANSVAVYGSNVYVAGCFQDTVDFNPSGGDPHSAPRGTNGFPNNDAFLCQYDTNGNHRWTKTWGGNGGDEAYDIDVDGSGFVYVCGDFSSTNMDLTPIGRTGSITNEGRWDAFIFKFNEAGSGVWAKAWGGAYYDDCTCVAVTEAGDAYGAGMFASPIADFDPGPATNYLYAHNPGIDWGLVDVFLTKFDTSGNFQWARCWGESNHWDAGQGVAVDEASNVYVSGYFTDTVDFNPLGTPSNITTHGKDDAFLCKYNASGDFQWVDTWGGTNHDYARSIAVDRAGYVYVSGDFQSGTVDLDPGSGFDNHSSSGTNDIALSKFDANGKFILARTCGGIKNDTAYGGIAADGSGNVFEAGFFNGSVDFGPLIGGSTNPPFFSGDSAYLAQISTCRRLTVIKSGNGWSSLGASSPATQIVSLNVTTQIVYTADDWYRIQTLASNSSVIAAAAGARIWTQALVNIAADVSNDVVFALATTNQTGYVNVPTVWLTNWAEDAVISDPAFDVHAKYLIGLDPTTSNTFELKIEAFSVSDSNAIAVLKRTYTGGISPDGMHGQLKLQATDNPGSAFTNVEGTAVTGAAVFDGADRKTYTNVIESENLFTRAVIQ